MSDSQERCWHADASQGARKVLGDCALEADALAARRVYEREPLCVEGEPVETELGAIAAVVGAVSVIDVACKGMIDAP
jgi:hypothetical protein